MGEEALSKRNRLRKTFAKPEARVSLEKIRQSYYRQMELLVGVKIELDSAMKEITLAHNAGLSALKSGTGKLGQRGTGSDTTAQGGYEFHRMQGASQYAAGQIYEAEGWLREAERALERAGDAIHNGWMDTDPDLGPERRAIRQAQAEESRQMTLTENPTPVILHAAATGDGAGETT
jgi:hypothetical protein